ncbi:Thioredoxin [Pseudomonas syringae]|uniref:thioredoxin family protein n=1 Tax=Pseudomonas syringae TaxID=317 RepID=UPI00089B6C4B|nr:thioredoxin domain-containing protein [Pseudomonas syringae]SDW94647.1 Thioredoxin [Pseudomonas syringae]SFM09855.1 Thioredoxin [Pseudomonas syringae]
MIKAEFEVLIEERIQRAAQKFADKKTGELDDMAQGKLGVYLALRRTLQGRATAQDLGMLDAINDTLQSLKRLDPGETFLNPRETALPFVVKNDDDFNRKWAEVSPLVLLEFSKPGANEHGEPDNSTLTGAILDELAPEFEGKVVMLRVPLDACSATAQHYNVTAAPTVIFIKNGKKIEETADFQLKFWFRAKLNELLSLKE